MPKKTVVVAMSGGVDSSTSAYKLLRDGYNVIGATLSMGRGTADQKAIEDAKRIADFLGIEHRVLDVADNFKNEVLQYFTDSYLRGETPNPCVKCNKFIKFKYLIDFMKEIKADYIATGHYAKITYENNKFKLQKPVNLDKDQSYFLSWLPYEYLQYIIFPLENMKSKDDVRALAKQVGLTVADKPDSQDICFISGDYKDFLKTRNIKEKAGTIKHLNGEILGKHNGISNYTIGQRKGLGISYKKPIYVVGFDVVNNIVYVGDNDDLFSNTLYLKDFNMLDDIDENREYTFKLRSTHRGDRGKINLKNLKITLNSNTRAITSGQLCCIYDNEQVMGSGWIV